MIARWLIALAACAKPPAAPSVEGLVETALVDAAQRHDAAAIAGYLKAPVANRGLWFADPACAARFPGPAAIEAADVQAFAACLATVPFAHEVHDGKAFLVYAPGVEVALDYALDGGHATITGIGHATIPGAPDAAHIWITSMPQPDGDRRIAPDPEDKVRFQRSGRAHTQGAFEVCFDGTGSVQRVAMLASTALPDYDRKIALRIKSFRFHPVRIGARAIAVCTAMVFTYSQR